jgi:hypothetical protein
MLLLDASLHRWLEDRSPELTLLGFLDDATRKVLVAEFFSIEDARGYFRLLRRVTELIGSRQIDALTEGLPVSLGPLASWPDHGQFLKLNLTVRYPFWWHLLKPWRLTVDVELADGTHKLAVALAEPNKQSEVWVYPGDENQLRNYFSPDPADWRAAAPPIPVSRIRLWFDPMDWLSVNPTGVTLRDVQAVQISGLSCRGINGLKSPVINTCRKMVVGWRKKRQQLILVSGTLLRGNPVWVRQFDAPEPRRRAEEFDPNALAFVGIVTEVDDPALLLLLREGIGKHQQRSHIQILVEVDQASVRIDDNCLRGGAEAAALLVLPHQHHPNAREDSGTASFAFVDGRGHGHIHGQLSLRARSMSR